MVDKALFFNIIKSYAYFALLIFLIITSVIGVVIFLNFIASIIFSYEFNTSAIKDILPLAIYLPIILPFIIIVIFLLSLLFFKK